MIEDIKTFGSRLKEALKHNNMTQSKLSEISGINTSTISEYIKGKYDPSRSRIIEFSKILKVNPVWLMGFDVSIKNSETFSIYQKKDLLKKIEEKGKEKGLNNSSIAAKFNLDKLDINTITQDFINVAEEFGIKTETGTYLSKNVNEYSKIKKWFLNFIETSSENELKLYKEIIETFNKINNRKEK